MTAPLQQARDEQRAAAEHLLAHPMATGKMLQLAKIWLSDWIWEEIEMEAM